MQERTLYLDTVAFIGTWVNSNPLKVYDVQNKMHLMKNFDKVDYYYEIPI